MPLPRMSGMAPRAGQYTNRSAMRNQFTLYGPGPRGSNGEPGLPSPVATVWAAIRALTADELDKAHQIAQRVTHLVTMAYLTGVSEGMQLGFQDGGLLRMLQIAAIEDPDEQHWELRLTCWEVGQNAGQNG
jgi:SPP1 family predicted phage head-tail adaptor